MSGIQAIQGSTTINAAGASTFSAPQVGAITGELIVLSLVGTTHAGYSWILAGPAGNAALLSDASAAAPTFRPDRAEIWTVVLLGLASNGDTQAVYMLPLDIPHVATSSAVGPLQLPYIPPTQVPVPGLGYLLYQDATKGGAVSTQDSTAVTHQVSLVRSGTTGARPNTTNLAIGTEYFDTTLVKPIWWTSTVWVDATGATV